MTQKLDYLIIGCGIMGLAVARALREMDQDAAIGIIDKEHGEAAHASSRNSGVLHAGFYYSADSLKARFTIEGNRALKTYCRQKHLPVNECGKLVVTQNEEGLHQLYELERRAKRNGSTVEIVDERRARELEPNVRTFKKALYSPLTASVDPSQICSSLRGDLEKAGILFSFGTKYLRKSPDGIQTDRGDFKAGKIINCAGLYADRIAQDFGFGQDYVMIPFKGIYLKYTKNQTDITRHIYPVPDLRNPFLGVHFTKTVTGSIKIGPTAIPAFWRENYVGLANFNLTEMMTTLFQESRLFISNAFDFRHLTLEELKKYNKKHLIRLAQSMVQSIDADGFTEYTRPGIRAQLLDKRLQKLVSDFVVQGDSTSTHILNAVSPAFTCALPFARYVVRNYIIAS